MTTIPRGRAAIAIALLWVSVPALAQAPLQPPTPQVPPVSLSLEEAVSIAVARSFRTGRAERNAVISDLRHDNAKAGYKPRIDLGTLADYSRRSYVEQGVDYDPYSDRDFRGGLNTNLWMPIDVSGSIKRQVRQADTQQQIAENEIGHAKLDVALEAQNNYLNALRAQENVTADEGVVEQIARLLESARTQSPGVVPFLEVELANAQQSLANSRAVADQAQDGLKQTLRMPLDQRLNLTSRLDAEGPTPKGADLLERALALRPDVQQARLRIRQAELARSQVGDHRRPSVSLNGYFNQEMVGPNPLPNDNRRIANRGVGVNVKVPLLQYDGGQLSRQKEIASVQTSQAVADAQELQERVAYDLRQAQLALERAENRIANLPDKKQAFDALKRAEQQMLNAPDGQAQSLLAQVSNARSAWRSAETASVDATIDYNRALFRLRRTLGDVEMAEAVPPPPQVPTIDAGSF
jgi:outer membrane protein TolC